MSTTLFPLLAVASDTPASAELPLYREVAWNYEANTPRWERGEPVIVTGKEAVRVWAWKALHVPRFRYEIYTRSYGSELESLIGRPFSEDLKRSEAARYVREALEINPYIKSVDEVSVEFSDGLLSISCTVTTIYGESEVSVSV